MQRISLEDEITKSHPKERQEADEQIAAQLNYNLVEKDESKFDAEENQEFYGNAQKYWSEIPATVNGMLGGLGYLSAIDVQSSIKFLRELKCVGRKCALDCGAGIGRVSQNLLMPRFDKVDLVEQDPAFSEKARQLCKENVYSNRLGEVYNLGLQHFKPVPGKYDLVWCQWVLNHLTAEDLLTFFIRIRSGLTKSGYLVLKENGSNSPIAERDETDSSLTRPIKTYETLLRQAGYRIKKTQRQQGFPKGLLPVYMIACRPAVEN